MTIPVPLAAQIGAASNVAINDNAFVIDLGDGYQQAGNTSINPQYEQWSITWPALSQADFISMKAVLDSVGCVTAMSMASPLDGVNRLYRIVKDSRKIQPVGVKWMVSLSLRQVFEP